jgi:hypothetical protein
MGLANHTPHGWQSQTSHESTASSFTSFENGRYPSGPEEWEEHHLMALIRDIITKYRFQSVAHFDNAINVKQAFRIESAELARNAKLNVKFIGFQRTESYVCRPVFRKHPTKKVYVPTKKVQILDNGTGRFIPLIQFLHTRYPSYPDSVKDDRMQAWWAANGKSFNWAGLPTEMKELVVHNCVLQPLKQSDLLVAKYEKWHHCNRTRHIPELLSKLVGWYSLLWTSHQVRAITLRTCFVGTTELGSYGAFSLAASTCASLAAALDGLGNFYQMIECNSVPTDYTTSALADCYKLHPKIYPQLSHYATLRHGLRKIHFKMELHSYMHFFKVTIGEFERYLLPGSISYEIFEQLPHLNEISILLPSKPRRGWVNEPYYGGPPMFHHSAPCPRLLHRVIYEHIAELLTPYPHVKVHNFVDDDEKARYKDLRRAAVQNRKWTAADFEELYAECGGGIELEEPVQPGSWLHEDEDKTEAEMGVEKHTIRPDIDQSLEEFFPPKCRCEEPCRELKVYV